MADTFHVLVLHKQTKTLIMFKSVQLKVDMSNLKFTISSKQIETTEEYPISLFKQYKIRSGGKYITIHGLDGNEKNISLMKFEFRESDPAMNQLAECLNMMVEKNKAINGSNNRNNSQKNRPRLPEHRTPAPIKVEPQRACSLIRTNTVNSVSSENDGQPRSLQSSQQRSQQQQRFKNSQDEAKQIANSKEMLYMFPAKAIQNQSAPLIKNPTPLRPANQNVRSTLNANPGYLKLLNQEEPDIPDTKSTPKVSATPKTPSTPKYVEYEPYSPSPIAKSPQKAAPLPVAHRTRLTESLVINKFKNRKLANIGNSCYMNATFQALSAVDHFTFRMRQTYSYLFQYRPALVERMEELAVRRLDLLKLSGEMFYTLAAGIPASSSSLKVFERNGIIEESCLKDIRHIIGIINSDFDNALQQDAHEFFIIFIAELERSVKMCAKKFYRYDNRGLAEVNDEFLKSHSEFRKMCPSDSFTIHFEMRLICLECGDIRCTEQSYQFDLNVTLRPNKTLQELIDDSHPCTKNPDVRCEKCKGLGAIMSTRVSQFPETLAVNLKRYTAHKNSMKKIDFIITVPLFIYTGKLANFQDEVMEFSEDEVELEEVNQLEIVKKSSPTSPPATTNISMDETQKNSPPSTPVSTKRRSSASHRALFCTEDPKNENIFDDDLNGNSSDNNNNNNNELKTGKLLGGVEVKTEVSDDLQIVDEKVCSTITFLPLSDLTEVKEILELTEIFDMNDDTLRRHLDNFEKDQIELNRDQMPANCKMVDPDGNCFYRAVSWLLTSTEEYHVQLRKKNVEFMMANAEVLSTVTNEPIENIIISAGNDTEWSSEVEIISMCSMLRCDIYTYLKKTWVRYQPKTDCEKRKGSLYLNNRKEVHYDPVIGIHPKKTTRGMKRKSPDYEEKKDEDGNDDEMPTRRQTYGRSCKTGKTYTENAVKLESDGKKETNNKKKKSMSEIVDWVLADAHPVYVLSSVVCHQGLSLNSGHYVAYTRNASTNEWLYCSDETVYSVSEERALKECAEKGYVFYYSRYKS